MRVKISNCVTPICYARPVEIERHKAAMKLPAWLGHPYTHTAGVLLALMAAVAVVAFMVGTLEYTKTRGKLLLTALLVGGFFLTTLGGTAIPRSGLGRRLRPVAPVMALAALLLLMVGLWAGADSDGFWKAAACATVLSLGFVITGVALALGVGRKSYRPFRNNFCILFVVSYTDGSGGHHSGNQSCVLLVALRPAVPVLACRNNRDGGRAALAWT